ncbi:MAG: chemotaxis response regulator protein-glutamate methylesterase [Gammaproteobacteria bacterium]
MKIAIVNDMQFAIEALRRIIVSQQDHQLVWVAENGSEAVRKCADNKPDLILMDIIMPIMNGVEATRVIMERTPCPILIVTSSVEGNASLVFQAMGAGALDAVKTPVLGISGNVQGDISLISKIHMIEKLTRGSSSGEYKKEPHSHRESRNDNGLLIAIGASTGGPSVLNEILSRFPEDFPAAIAVIQHVDAHFALDLADWLNEQCAMDVGIINDGDHLTQGRVMIAATNDHLVLRSDMSFKYTPNPRELVYRPSVDVFFDSVTDYWGGKTIGVLLTGMGRDGAIGLLGLHEKGVHTIAQDEQTSAVYGMPKAAVALGAASEILPSNKIADKLIELVMAHHQKKRFNVL